MGTDSQLDAKIRFNNLTKTFKGLDDVIESISLLRKRGRLNELSESYLQDISGWGHKKVREIIVILECFGFLVAERGKTTSVNSNFTELADVKEDDVFDIIKKHISDNQEALGFVRYLASNNKVGEKIPSERDLEKDVSTEIQIDRGKIREVLLRLECGGFIERKPQTRRILKESLDSIIN